ncbi:MAG: DUF756 domain-containing protein, partial [Asticcacaulis sp.]|nr:DUF756 domain-containing protein [Asticcacaulis sp.]
ADGNLENVTVALALKNNSRDAAAVFHVYSGVAGIATPFRYTLAPGGSATASIPPQDGMTDVHVLGPNGFYRRFTSVDVAGVNIGLAGSTLTMANSSQKPLRLTVRDEAYGRPAVTLAVAPGQDRKLDLDLAASHNWYDIGITGPGVYARFAGHIEDGRSSMSDPALGGAAPLTIADKFQL